MDFIKRLFRKEPKRRTTRELVKELERYEQELQNLGHELTQVKWEKGLVEPERWSSKYAEAMADGSKFAFHLSSFITHIRCLHQWQTNTPPTLNKPETVPTESAAIIATEDQEFIDKLNEALEWKKKQK